MVAAGSLAVPLCSSMWPARADAPQSRAPPPSPLTPPDRRLRVSGDSFGMAFFLFLCGLVLMSLQDGIWWHVGVTLVTLSAPFFIMTLMPTDVKSIYTISVGLCIFCIVTAVMILTGDVSPQADNLNHGNCTFSDENRVVCVVGKFSASTANASIFGLVALVLLYSLRPNLMYGFCNWQFERGPRALLGLLWSCTALGCGTLGAVRLLEAIVRIAYRTSTTSLDVYPDIFATGGPGAAAVEG